MAYSYTPTFDAVDPPSLAEFWAVALDYQLEPPPDGFETWGAWCDMMEIPLADRSNYAAIVDPGTTARVLFLKVPEPKTAKNRQHLDIRATEGLSVEEHPAARDAHAKRLEELGATLIDRRDEHGASWIVMEDPEGNVFCVI